MGDMIIPVSMDLATFEVASCDLSQEYWTPNDVGEKRRMVFVEVTERTVLDQKTAEEILLPCVVFIQPINGESKTVVNGSKRLVAVFENNAMEPGTPVEITYKGKKKNRTNGNMSDDWSVVKLSAAKAKK
jgi:hypothetical protein